MQLNLLTPQESQKTRERVACEAGDPVAQIVAIVDGMAARKCSARQIVEAVRAFALEARPAPAETREAGAVWVRQGSPEWASWAAFWRAEKGKSPPVDSRGGWRFPSRFPPPNETKIPAAIVAAE